jgi:hypothetical protein
MQGCQVTVGRTVRDAPWNRTLTGPYGGGHPMSETTAEGTIREALEVAVRILDTDWEPADLDRDVVDPLRAALAALDHLLAQEARVRALVEYKRKQGRYNSIMGLISPDELEAVLDQPQKESTG